MGPLVWLIFKWLFFQMDASDSPFIDPLGQPIVTVTSDHYFNPCRPFHIFQI